MTDKQIKIWIPVFVFTLMTVGGAASYFAQGRMFYKGMEPLEKQVSSIRYQVSAVEDVVKTSVLHVEEEKNEESPEVIAEAPQTQEAAVTSPCPSGEIPMIKNGQVSGCSKKTLSLRDQPASERSNLAGPKVRILTEPSHTYNLHPTTYQLSTCESQGLFTYTGPDRPGLLYGMCIECLTNTYIMNEGCPASAGH